MYNIYLIEDCNGLKYVGKTMRTLKRRMGEHIYCKKQNHKPSSSCKLDLEHSTISLLEICDESNNKVREQYWISKIDCVNELNATFDKKFWTINRDSWGGDPRSNNNLLRIDIKIFE